MTSTLDLPTVGGPAPTAVEVGPAPGGTRIDLVLDFVKHPDHHRQALRFLCVGGSGYIVNNIAFALLTGAAGVQHTVSFWIASLIGTANNFWWNRNWTFDAKHHHIARQGMRFLLVSLTVSGLAYVFYLGLVVAGVSPKVLANALAYVIATPFSFLAQKLWSFRA